MHIATGKWRGEGLNKFQAVVTALRRAQPGSIDGGDKPAALAISCDVADRETLQEIFRAAGWRLTIADTVSIGLATQRKHPVPIILFDRRLPEGDWRKTVSALAGLAGNPWVILLSDHCDQNLWDDLTAMGGSDILRTPLNATMATRAIKSGWLVWRHLQKFKE